MTHINKNLSELGELWLGFLSQLALGELAYGRLALVRLRLLIDLLVRTHVLC